MVIETFPEMNIISHPTHKQTHRQQKTYDNVIADDFRALTKQISDDKYLAAEPPSFSARAKKWGISLSNGRRINDEFYGKLTSLYPLQYASVVTRQINKSLPTGSSSL